MNASNVRNATAAALLTAATAGSTGCTVGGGVRVVVEPAQTTWTTPVKPYNPHATSGDVAYARGMGRRDGFDLQQLLIRGGARDAGLVRDFYFDPILDAAFLLGVEESGVQIEGSLSRQVLNCYPSAVALGWYQVVCR